MAMTMARPPTAAAAAGGLACAAVLLLCLFVGQSVATTSSTTPPVELPSTSFKSVIVRIYSKENIKLNMAVRNDRVVLVEATEGDKAQLWWKIFPATTLADGEGDKFWLVNVATGQATVNPTGDSKPVKLVKLVKFDPNNKEELWVPDTPRTEDGAFYQIKPFASDGLMALTGEYVAEYKETQIWVSSSAPVTPNKLWLITDTFPCPSS